ncbi:hypothetical protein K503DRAFT_864718 [Rhizopogon vinicolor AM-OR11-026]|uniref:DNA polymerase delta subunit 4 n=1 Tax=Rhizopogon vinicolor AM-OR11-026 TaxID=1314800 RepID=A0A1B7N656_9AGAM|nr:hypothetical protein K503DRAFT_864718 [Rhizopogon vinicolor AM-OR11-026]
MTPAKNSSSRNGSAPLKQGTLSFSSAKRTNSNTAATGKTKIQRPSPEALVQRSSSAIEKEKQRGDEAVDEEVNEEELEIGDDVSQNQTRRSAIPSPNATKVAIRTSSAKRSKPEEDEDSPAVEPASADQRPSLDVTAKNYRKHYGRVREKMGNLEPIHAEGQNKIHQILRVFDMSYKYGPCVGMTRLERWERAASLGLGPPQEVRDILLTREGVGKDEYSQCVLYGEV